MKTIKLEKADGIAWVYLNRPEKRNAMSPTLHYEADAVLAQMHAVARGADRDERRLRALLIDTAREPLRARERARAAFAGERGALCVLALGLMHVTVRGPFAGATDRDGRRALLFVVADEPALAVSGEAARAARSGFRARLTLPRLALIVRTARGARRARAADRNEVGALPAVVAALVAVAVAVALAVALALEALLTRRAGLEGSTAEVAIEVVAATECGCLLRTGVDRRIEIRGPRRCRLVGA